MRIVIVGSVAAGTSVGAKARRNTETAEIVIYDRDRDISYSGCGLPYYVGGEVEDIDALTPRDAAWFAKRYNIDIRTGHEVIGIDPSSRTITVVDRATGVSFTDSYDELVLATGVSPIVPPLRGVSAAGVFTVRTPSNAQAIRSWIEATGARRAVVVGAGFIGLEMVEQLTGRGIATTLVERLAQVMPTLDADMAARVGVEVERHGVDLRLGSSLREVVGDPVTSVVLEDGTTIATDLVIMAVGVRPNVELAVQAGVPVAPGGPVASRWAALARWPSIIGCTPTWSTFGPPVTWPSPSP